MVYNNSYAVGDMKGITVDFFSSVGVEATAIASLIVIIVLVVWAKTKLVGK
jgi:hypothetical protein